MLLFYETNQSLEIIKDLRELYYPIHHVVFWYLNAVLIVFKWLTTEIETIFAFPAATSL